jgi:hypothetical protein
MIQLLRQSASTYLLKHRESELNGLCLELAVSGDSPSMEDYVTTHVLPMGKEARTILLMVMPLMLGLKVNTMIVDATQDVSILLLRLRASTSKSIMPRTRSATFISALS